MCPATNRTSVLNERTNERTNSCPTDDPCPAADIAGAPVHYPSGITLFRQDDPVRVLYLIDAGVVRLSRRDGSHQLLIGLRSAGWLLGTSAAILARVHPVTATTLGECRLRQVPLAAFLPKCAEPALAAWLLRMQARKALDHLTTLGVFGLSHPRPRLEYLLSRLLFACGTLCADGSMKLVARLTHEDYAEAIGTSREYVTRLLAQLCREGVLQKSNGWLIATKGSSLMRPVD